MIHDINKVSTFAGLDAKSPVSKRRDNPRSVDMPTTQELSILFHVSIYLYANNASYSDGIARRWISFVRRNPLSNKSWMLENKETAVGFHCHTFVIDRSMRQL
jgi:hypothetical protein